MTTDLTESVTSAGPHEAERPAPSPARRWGFLLILSLGLFLVAADNSILYTALPTLRQQLHTTELQGLWIINAYPLVLCGLLLSTGTLGDKIGHRRMFLIGAATFGVASAVATASPNAEALIAARALLGFGAATMMPATLALIRQTFPEPRERSIAISIWVAVSVVGAASGPVLGGLLLEHLSWHAVFLINIPVAAVAVLGTLIIGPVNKPDHTRHWDIVSSVWAMFAMLGGVIVIKELANPERSPWLLAAAAVVAVIAGTLFGHRQRDLRRRGRTPLLEFAVFRNPVLVGGTIAAVLAMFIMAGAELMTTQRFQTSAGFSPFQAGALVAIAAVSAIPASVLGGTFLHRVGFRPLITGGFLVIAAGLALTVWALPHAPLWVFAGGLVAVGVGSGMVMSVSSTAIIDSAPTSKAGMAASIEEVSYEFGTLGSVAILGSVMPMLFARFAPDTVPADVDVAMSDPAFAQQATAAYDAAYQGVLIITMIVALVAAALTARCFRGNPKGGTSAHE